MTTSGSLAIFRAILLLKTARKYKIPTVYHIRFGKTRQMAENEDELAEAIYKAYLERDKLAELGTNGRTYVEKELDSKVCIGAYINILTRMQ